MCVTDLHDMTLAVKVALNLNTTNQFCQAPNFVLFTYTDKKKNYTRTGERAVALCYSWEYFLIFSQCFQSSSFSLFFKPSTKLDQTFSAFSLLITFSVSLFSEISWNRGSFDTMVRYRLEIGMES